MEFDVRRYLAAYSSLKDNERFKEQDTIERLIVPFLSELGWKVYDDAYSWCLLRGDRNHNGNPPKSTRRFDLNLYDSKNDRRTKIAIEVKPAGSQFRIPLNGVEHDHDVIAGNKSSIGQVMDQMFNPKFGIDCDGVGITRGFTIGVWTEGKKWVVFRFCTGDNLDDGWRPIPEGLFPHREDYHLQNPPPRMAYQEFEIDSDPSVMDLLKNLLGPSPAALANMS